MMFLNLRIKIDLKVMSLCPGDIILNLTKMPKNAILAFLTSIFDHF